MESKKLIIIIMHFIRQVEQCRLIRGTTVIIMGKMVCEKTKTHINNNVYFVD